MFSSFLQYHLSINKHIAKRIILCILFLPVFTTLETKAQEKKFCIKNIEGNKLLLKPISDSIQWAEQLQEWQDNDQNKGYLLAGTDSISSSQRDTITAWYTRGRQFYWLKLTPDSASQLFVSQFNLQKFEKKSVKLKQWTKAKQTIVSYYRENGYPNANIKLQQIEIKHDSVKANLSFNPGVYVQFGEVIVQGDAQISPAFIARHIGLKNGNAYSSETAKNIDKRLKELNYINIAHPSEIYRIGNVANAYLFLTKRNASQFSGILGVASNNKVKSRLLLTGEINLNLVNALKKGEELSLEWQKLQELTQELKTRFVFPYIKGSAFGVDAGFALYKQDTTYLTTNPTIGIRYQTRGSSYTRLFLEAKTSNILLQQSTADTVGGISQQLYGIEYYDINLDNCENPYKGYKFNISASTGQRTLKPLDKSPSISENRQQYKLDAEIFIPLASKLTLKLRNYSAYLSGNTHVLNEMYRIGGINNLRGVEENSLRVSAFTVQTTEIRLIIESASALFVFFDGAWYEQRLKTGYYTDKPIGIGAGVQFQTKAGIFSLQYAAGQQKGSPLSFTQAKIHIGYISRF